MNEVLKLIFYVVFIKGLLEITVHSINLTFFQTIPVTSIDHLTAETAFLFFSLLSAPATVFCDSVTLISTFYNDNNNSNNNNNRISSSVESI